MRTIFLSYAHSDNLAPPGGERQGWVNFFDESLNIELTERALGAKLWRDKRDFDPMALVYDTLKSATDTSDLMLAVLSPLYVQQTYTKFELDSFVESKAANGSNEAGRRILLVLKRGLADDKYPDAIRGMGYVPFFDLDRQTNQEKPYYQGYGQVISDKYWDAIGKVASLIEQHLNALAPARDVAAPAPGAPQPPAHEAAASSEQKKPAITVYLAATSGDAGSEHWSVRKELESQGCRVVPADPWPASPDAARQHLREAVAAADFSVHLLGSECGADAASGLTGLSGLQLDLAAERVGKDPAFRRFIWLKAGSPTEPAQKALLASLDGGERLLARDELMRSGLESFKDVIRDELASRRKQAQPPRLYLICQAADEAEALALRPALTTAGFETELPEFGADGAVPRQEDERCLRECDAVLVYWGNGTEGQVRKRLDDVEEAVATLRRSRPFALRALYLGPPSTPRKTTFASHFVDATVQGPDELASLRARAGRQTNS